MQDQSLGQFVVMLVTIMKINVSNKRVENVFNQLGFGVTEMKIVFYCCGCSSWENIDIGIDIEKK
jgi:hypothetical protein